MQLAISGKRNFRRSRGTFFQKNCECAKRQHVVTPTLNIPTKMPFVKGCPRRSKKVRRPWQCRRGGRGRGIIPFYNFQGGLSSLLQILFYHRVYIGKYLSCPLLAFTLCWMTLRAPFYLRAPYLQKKGTSCAVNGGKFPSCPVLQL